MTHIFKSTLQFRLTAVDVGKEVKHISERLKSNLGVTQWMHSLGGDVQEIVFMKAEDHE